MDTQNLVKDLEDLINDVVDAKLKPIQEQINELKKSHTIEIKISQPANVLETFDKVIGDLKSKIQNELYKA